MTEFIRGMGLVFSLIVPILETLVVIVGLVVVILVGFYLTLPWIVQPFLRMALFLRYDLRPIGRENIPKTGPVLIVSNHVTWFDGFFIAATLPRRGTALVNAGAFAIPIIGALARRCGLISIPYKGPKAQRAAIEACRKALDDGEALGIFPESQLTRNGMTGLFFRGLEVILGKRTDVAVIPVYMDNGWGSIMSHSEGKFLWKKPQGWRRTIIIVYGPRIALPTTAFEARQAVMIEGVKARSMMPKPPMLPEPIDANLPHFEHPTLGRLTGSAIDIHEEKYAVHQLGQKPGSVGLPLPGIAIQAVDDAGHPLLANVEGKLQALVPGQKDWVDLGQRGKLDPDGFVFLSDPGPT